MRKLLNMILIICLCTGCSKEPLKEDKENYQEMEVDNTSYFLPGHKLKIEKDGSGQAKQSFIIENEMELVQAIQYNIENGKMNVQYRSNNEIDIQEIAEMLSSINPFDVSVNQSSSIELNQEHEVIDKIHELQIQILDEQYATSLAFAKKKTKELIHENMSINEKIKAIHDYIVTSTKYDEASLRSKGKDAEIFRASGVFQQGKAVCTGYSRAFMMLAREAGIKSILISKDDLYHSWNYVYDGAYWRYIDVTWDDPLPDRGELISNQFLNLSKEEFIKEGSHQLNEKEITYYDNIVENIFFTKYH